MTTTIERTDLIERIIAAARRPMKEPVEAKRLRDPETGREYLINGVPHGIPYSRLQWVVVGWVWYDRYRNTTYGTVAPTREALIERHNAAQAKLDKEFREALLAMDDERLASQVAYWLGE